MGVPINMSESIMADAEQYPRWFPWNTTDNGDFEPRQTLTERYTAFNNYTNHSIAGVLANLTMDHDFQRSPVHLVDGAPHGQNSAHSNFSNMEVPRFNHTSLIVCSLFGVIFLLSLIGNVLTLVHMIRIPRRRRNTIQTLILHLATADLCVTFFCVLTDGIWGATVQWLAGTVMCKILKFLQLFSLYLSTYIIVIISIDRCYAIKDPMSRNNAPVRVRNLIIVAYVFSALFSLPQLFIFRTARAPFEEDFVQCVTYGFYTADWQERLYATLSMFFLYIFPLVTMLTCYLIIFCTIAKKSRSFRESPSSPNCCKTLCKIQAVGLLCFSSSHAKNESFSMSDLNSSAEDEHANKMLRGPVRSQLLRRAKSKSLRMTLVIVMFFFLWWLPYWISFVGFVYFGWDDQEKFDASIHTWIFCFGMSNSAVNPVIYGAFHFCKTKRTKTLVRKQKSNSTRETPASSRKGSQRQHGPDVVPNGKGANVMKYIPENGHYKLNPNRTNGSDTRRNKGLVIVVELPQ